MAGRWAQLEANKEARPFLQYRTAGDARVRPQHRAWNGLIYPIDDAFWSTHYPPNGWGCHCWVTAASQADYDKAVEAGRAEPPQGWNNIDQKSGAPIGIDKGWAYAPGANTKTELKDLVEQKLFKLNPTIGAAFLAEMAVLLAETIATEAGNGSTLLG